MYEGAEALAREASRRHEVSGYYGEGGRGYREYRSSDDLLWSDGGPTAGSKAGSEGGLAAAANQPALREVAGICLEHTARVTAAVTITSAPAP